jgi:competence protein ComEA
VSARKHKKTESNVTKESASALKKLMEEGISKEKLEALPEIGPVKAQAIIDGRLYKKAEDKVKGIKERECKTRTSCR